MRVIILLSLFIGMQALAQENAVFAETRDHESLHDELRTLKTKMLTALNERNVEQVLDLVDDEMIFIPMNAEVCKGKDTIRAYFDRMLNGEERIVEDMELNLEVEELTTLHGQDTGIAFGKAENIFRLTSGMELRINTSWTATLINKDNRWLIASYQSSVNPLDNPILTKSKSFTKTVAGGAALAGCIFGACLAVIIRPKKPVT